MNKVKEFWKKNSRIVIIGLISMIIIYFLIYLLTPVVKMSELNVYKLDQLQLQIESFQKNQQKFDSLILDYKNEIDNLEVKISKIKNEKTIIKEIYHEEISRVDNYDDHQLDSFFAKRYGFYTR